MAAVPSLASPHSSQQTTPVSRKGRIHQSASRWCYKDVPLDKLCAYGAEIGLKGIDLLNIPRSDIPAVTHIDYSARVQTVHEETNPRYYRLLKRFETLTGCAVLVNTSFNVRGEPIVCTPEDAYRCFMRTEMDLLVLGNHLVYKKEQVPLQADTDWKKEYVLD